MAVALLVAGATLAVSSVLVWQSRERERRDSYFHRIALAQRELSANNLGRALDLLDECPPDLREWEWHYLQRLCRVDPLIFLGQGQGIRGVAFSPDGRRLAAANEDGTIGLFDVDTGEVLPSLVGHTGKVRSLAFHPQGTRLASTSADRTVNVWDLNTGQVLFSLEGNSGVHGAANGVAFSPDGRLLAAANEAGQVILCSAMDGQVFQRLGPHEAFAVAMAFSPDSRLLATGSWRGVLRVWDTQTGNLLHEKEDGDGRALSALAFRPDGLCLATAGYNRQVTIRDVATGELLQNWRAHDCIILGLSFCPPDGRRLATIGGEDKTVKLWDPLTGREVLNLRGHTYFGGCVVFSPDGRRLASSDRDGTVRIWDATPADRGQELMTLWHDDEVWNVAYSPDGQRIGSASFDATVRLWDAASGALLHSLNHSTQVFSFAFSRDGRFLVSVTRDKTACIWDAATGRRLKSFTTPNEHLYSAVFSPDGRYLLVDDVGGRPIPEDGYHAVTVWDAQAGESSPKVVGIVGRHREDIWCLEFSPDGDRLASASNDGNLKLWHWDPTRLGEPARPLLALSVRGYGFADCAAFTPDGQRLVGAAGEIVKIWDAHTGDELPPLRGHSGQVIAVAVSPDGRWLASAGEDTTIVLWDTQTSERRHTLRGHTGMVMSLAFSPDSRRLVSGSRDKLVKVWDITRWNKAPDR
jgi:WD40 repeat protein